MKRLPATGMLLLTAVAAGLAFAQTAVEPVTPNPSPEPRALLKAIQWISGRNTLSGQANTPAAKSKHTDQARFATGKWPALWGSDLGYAAQGDDSIRARGEMTAEAKRQFGEGSLIALTWTAVRPIDDEPADRKESVQGRLTDEQWQQLSSAKGDLPVPPGGSKQQTGALVGDFDRDGIKEFILSFRQKPPALVWYRRAAGGWDAWTIEDQYLTVEAGGAAHDIDGDGDLDIVFGGDWQSNEVWWWENPAPNFDRTIPWKRRLIKQGGQNQHHDQVFGDFLGTGRSQLAFWNQRASTLFLAEIPAHPRSVDAWPLTPMATGVKPAGVPYIEGASAFDVDADGKVDVLACDSWFKHTGGKEFKRVQFADPGGLIFAGYFKPSKYPQIVVSPGDAGGPVRIYECTGNPENSADWHARELLPAVIHGHSLQLGDINGDGHLDIFVAEMAKWHDRQSDPDHPEATAWIFHGDGKGDFSRTELVKGHGWHEARLADLDGDGDLDLLNKPYTWETPRVDVWINNGTQKSARGVDALVVRPAQIERVQLVRLKAVAGKAIKSGWALFLSFKPFVCQSGDRVASSHEKSVSSGRIARLPLIQPRLRAQ